jgi:sigma-B regulation protein RsbU (phosphoserine phosphatase)
VTSIGDEPARAGPGGAGPADKPTLTALLEDSPEDLYEHAPCGYLSTLPDGEIAKVNATLLGWLGYAREDLVGRRSFADLLTVGGRIYHETHLAPLLAMRGQLGGIALELLAADGTRLPVLVTSAVKAGPRGEPLLVRTTIFDARDRRAYEQELLRARQESDRERHRLQDLVTTLQRSLLPPALPAVPGLEAAAHYRIASADEVGGDFYDLFPLPGRWGLFLGDVCGKGAHAAALTSLIRYTLRAAAVYDPDPAAVLHTLNTALREEYERDGRGFCTAIFGLLTPETDGFSLTFASGGHPDPLLTRADGTVAYQAAAPRGLLLGVLDDAVYTAVTLRLRPGDSLLLYTDGLTEARAGHGRYGDESLRDFIAGLGPATAAQTVAALSALLDTFSKGLEDDTAILALSIPR